MKTLIESLFDSKTQTTMESLFDSNIAEKDPLDNPEFKEWINLPDVLWYIYYYWVDEMEDPLEDFHGEAWSKYKPYVDNILENLEKTSKRVFGTKGCLWWWTNFEQYELDDWVRDKFESKYEEGQAEYEFTEGFDSVTYEIKHKSTEMNDGVWKTWFKGSLPKGSNVTLFLQDFDLPVTKPGKLDGGIFITNEDAIIALFFPKGTDKNILKLFNIK